MIRRAPRTVPALGLTLGLAACVGVGPGGGTFSGAPLVVTEHDPRYNDVDAADPEALVRFAAVAVREERALGCRLAAEIVRAPQGRMEIRFEVGLYEGKRIFSIVVAADDLSREGDSTPHEMSRVAFRRYQDDERPLLSIPLEPPRPPLGYLALFRRPAGHGPVYLLGSGESADSAATLIAALYDGRLAVGITLSARRQPYHAGWTRWDVQLPAAPVADRDAFEHCLTRLPRAPSSPGEDDS